MRTHFTGMAFHNNNGAQRQSSSGDGGKHHEVGMPRPQHGVGLLTTVLASLAFGSVIAAEARSAAYRLDIPAQSLHDALEALARVSQHKLLYSAELADGKNAPAVKGRYTTEQAVQQLLSGTNLIYEVSDGLVLIWSQDQPRAFNASAAREIRLAQVGDGQPTSTSPASQRSEPATLQGSGDSQSVTLQEVIVTAQRREQRLQDVPISIQVMGGEALDTAKVQGVSEALSRVAGVSVTQDWEGMTSQISVRGVTSLATEGGSSPVGYYLDTIPFGLIRQAASPDANAYDLDRVEVLRGPQGTLYGASALSGVVRVLTKDADVNNFDLKGRASTSSTEGGGNSYRGDLAVNVPIIEGKLAARAVVGYQDLGGWVDKPLTGERDVNSGIVRTARVKINAQPTDELSIGLFAWSSNAEFRAPSFSTDSFTQNGLLPQPIDTSYEAYGLKVGYEFPGVSLSSATSYLDYFNGSKIDTGFVGAFDSPEAAPSYYNPSFHSHVFSQEFQLSSNLDGAWRWSAGVFYRDAHEAFILAQPMNFDTTTNTYDASKSWAVFGEVGRRFLEDRLELTLGLRRFQDEVETHGVFWDGQIFPTESFKFKATTPRVVLTWTASPELTVYGSYSQGFRSGLGQGIAVRSVAPGVPPAHPDKLNSYEVGAKGYLWDRRVSFEAAIYYQKWTDALVNRTIQVGGGFTDAIVNSSAVSGPGAEFSISTRPFKGLELGVNYAWNDLTQEQDIISAGTLLWSKGDRLNDSLKYSAGAFLDYTVAFGGSGLSGTFSASGDYNAGRSAKIVPFDPEGTPGPALLSANTSFSVTSIQGWTGTLFVENLTNNRKTSIAPNKVFPDWGAHLRPRTVGLQFEYHLK